MNQKTSINWMTAAGIIGIIFGIFYALFGLEGLPAYRKLVPSGSLLPWSHGLYGAVFIGFAVLLLFIGRHAFQTGDRNLMKILLYGMGSWLLVEALFSVVYGVYFNVGVDICLMVFIGFPLMNGVRSHVSKK